MHLVSSFFDIGSGCDELCINYALMKVFGEQTAIIHQQSRLDTSYAGKVRFGSSNCENIFDEDVMLLYTASYLLLISRVFDELVDFPICKVVLTTCFDHCRRVFPPLSEDIRISGNLLFGVWFDWSTYYILSPEVSNSLIEKELISILNNVILPTRTYEIHRKV